MFTALFNNNILNIKPSNNSYINNSSKTNALLFFNVILNQNKKKKKQSIVNIINKVNNMNIINNKSTIILIMLMLSLTFTFSIANTYANNKHSCLIQKKENGKIEYNTKYGKNCTLLRPVTLTDVNVMTLSGESKLNGNCILNTNVLQYKNTEKIINKKLNKGESYSIKCKTGYITRDNKEFVYKCNNNNGIGELLLDSDNSSINRDCIKIANPGCHEYTIPGQYTFEIPGGVEELEFEVKGGQGLGGSDRGCAGVTTGTFVNNNLNELYVVVGGGVGGLKKGGYNGGGNCDNACGGGATHISKYPGLLSNDEVHANVLVVAGGSGGGSGPYHGGGGNNNAKCGWKENNNCTSASGTITAGGIGNNGGENGSKGQGGYGYNSGGGGYYGGGGGDETGGGSGFCGNGMTNCAGEVGVYGNDPYHDGADGYAKISWGGYSGSCSEMN